MINLDGLIQTSLEIFDLTVSAMVFLIMAAIVVAYLLGDKKQPWKG